MDMKAFSLEGKIALVTGASYGIGFAIAKGMAAAGATIVFNDIKQELVDKGLAAYKEAGIDAHGYVCDVTDEDAVNALVKKVEEEVGVIDILVNNAGIIKRIPMLEMSAKDFRQVIDVDLNAPFIVAKAVIPLHDQEGPRQDHQHLLDDERAGPRDRVRVCGGQGRPQDAHPQHRLRVRRAQHPVQRHRPGLHRHAADRAAARAPAGRQPSSVRPVHHRQDPGGPLGRGEDLAGPAVFLASDASNFVNGHILYVDGGILAYIGKQP